MAAADRTTSLSDQEQQWQSCRVKLAAGLILMRNSKQKIIKMLSKA
jgi:hypothetical protein